jgi:hypothetical protein
MRDSPVRVQRAEDAASGARHSRAPDSAQVVLNLNDDFSFNTDTQARGTTHTYESVKAIICDRKREVKPSIWSRMLQTIIPSLMAFQGSTYARVSQIS